MLGRLGALLLATTLVGCDTTAKPSTAPTQVSGATTGASQPAEPDGSIEASGSPAPIGSAAPFPSFDAGREPALPEPTMTEPFDIGQALFDPGRVADAVVSLVALMGVEVDDDAGGVLRAGTDAGAGRLVLTESEVRGLIDMTREDMAAMSDSGAPPVPIRDIYLALAPSLPSAYTLDDFAGAYGRAYSEHPDAFVSRVLLGMPIDADTTLTRLQAWLLYIDGFLGSRTQAARAVSYTAASGASLGTATPYQPPITSQIAGVSNASWTYLLSRLPTLAYTIPFGMQGVTGVHEGHGGQGQPATISANVTMPGPLLDPMSGQVILEPHRGPDGITMQWSSDSKDTLARHGTLDRALPSSVTTDGSGAVRITYTPRKEVANGQGQVVTDVASLYAEVDAAELVRNVYFVASSQGLLDTVLALARGKVRSRPGTFTITWHEKDTFEFYIRNKLDVTVDVGAGSGPDLQRVRRVGQNEAKGILFNNGDGTYRGSMLGWVNTSMDGTSFVGECHDQTDALQWVYVVGHVIDAEVAPPFVIVDGKRGGQDLMLYFYPASPPVGTLGKCQGTMDFPGGGPDDQPAGALLPFNDTMWTAIFNTNNWQDMLGLRIYLPSEGTLNFTDNRDIYPQQNIFSQWNIVVTKPPR